MTSRGTRGPSGVAVGTVALTSLLNPLNTSMLAVALPQVQREFGTSAGASTWLHTLFAFVSAIGHPSGPARSATRAHRGPPIPITSGGIGS
jgi:MFS family permease